MCRKIISEPPVCKKIPVCGHDKGILFSPRDPAFWRVVFGLHHLYNYESSTVKRHVRAIVMHSGFKRSTYENDVALFKLKRPISYSDYIQPICLPNSTTQLVADENPCFISGWGNTEEKGKYLMCPLICVKNQFGDLIEIGDLRKNLCSELYSMLALLRVALDSLQ